MHTLASESMSVQMADCLVLFSRFPALALANRTAAELVVTSASGRSGEIHIPRRAASVSDDIYIIRVRRMDIRLNALDRIKRMKNADITPRNQLGDCLLDHAK